VTAPLAGESARQLPKRDGMLWRRHCWGERVRCPVAAEA
jgi:hypothetical protein